VPQDVKLPELAESVVEGEVLKWLVAVGDAVVVDQPIVEVMTDKVTVELPSPLAGVLAEIVAPEGAVVPVGAVLARVHVGGGVAGAVAGAEPPGGANAPAPAPATPTAEPGGRAATVTPPAVGGGAAPPRATPTAGGRERAASPLDGEGDDADAADGVAQGDEFSLFKASADDDTALPTVRRRAVGASDAGALAPRGGSAPASDAPTALRGAYGRVVAVPAARRLARELGVPIEQVLGSGPAGRVRVDDVRREAAHVAPATGGLPAAVRPVTPKGYEERERRVPLRGLRRAITNQMVASHLHTVRALHVDEADVTELVRLRERLKPRAEARGVRLSYLPLIMKAVGQVLPAYPALASALDDVTQEIVLRDYVNLGMAVATDAGLVVPVIRDVDRKPLIDVAEELQGLAAKARDGKLAPDDVRGGTFTITNIGSVGGLFSFPIINVPEAAILGVHAIRKRPVVLPDDTIAARPMLYLSLSFDHRLVDGADAARFTNLLIDLLQAPEAMLLDA
jgi:2-oxoisovalerate dehydrogenase E2 component (dihydrolipoyl transacylase)